MKFRTSVLPRPIFAILVAGIFCCPLQADQPAATARHTVQLNGHNFTLPDGFTIELVAIPPLADRPIVADFDEQGRLYVADSSGSNEPVNVQLEKKPHRIVRLEDTDGDRRFDKRTVFADRMMFPEGTMWYRGSLYVSAPPVIWKLTDTNNDGIADERVEWFDGKTLTGCANDLHGPYLGRDGWFYWCKGAFAKQTYEQPGKPPFVTRASHIFRARPDGTGIESVMTGGMDNPVDVVFTPAGERLMSCTFFQNPGGGQRDGLIHAIYGGVYGKDHDPIHEHVWTSPELMPVLSHLGPAAPCGLALYESNAFGNDYQDNVFTACFNLRKITRHVLTPDGGSLKSGDEDFLTSDNLDFHPPDVLEDADGSLLVIDTGGWFKLCCPTSQLEKPDVLGAIYRVRRIDAKPIDDPRGTKIDWAKVSARELSKLLGDERPVVRARAIDTLHARGDVESLDASTESTSTSIRLNVVWAATRIESDAARAAVRRALSDRDESVQQAAAHSVGLWRDGKAVAQLIVLLKHDSAHVRRAAAEALGRCGDSAAVRPLLDALASPSDRALEHSLTYALIEIADGPALIKAIASDNPRVRRAALVALDQLKSPQLQASHVIEQLESGDASLRDAAWWIIGRHTEWGDAVSDLLRVQLTSDLPEERRQLVISRAAKLANSGAVQHMLAMIASGSNTPTPARRAALHAMSASRFRNIPESWIQALTIVTATPGNDLLDDVLTTARALNIPASKAGRLTDNLTKLADNESVPRQTRVLALAALPGTNHSLSRQQFDVLLAVLTTDTQPDEKILATEALARGRLTADQLLSLTNVVAQAGPIELDRLLPLFAQNNADNIGQALLDALAQNPARQSFRPDLIRPAFASLSAALKESVEKLLADLHQDAAAQRAELGRLLPRLANGDIRRGQAVFHSTKAACNACHAIGYVGGRVGPDLSSIGKVRSDRDLLEAILFPSASLVRSYESVEVVRTDGRSHNGVIRGDTGGEITLATGPNQELRISRSEIETIQPSTISVMPAGLDKQISEQELADLLAFLRSRRQ
jgi:putative membrane-bound dehydrogenase-like protein